MILNDLIISICVVAFLLFICIFILKDSGNYRKENEEYTDETYNKKEQYE